MRRFTALLAASLALTFLAGAGLPVSREVVLNSAQRALLDRVSDYLNGIHTLKSQFLQVNPDGHIAQGDFYLRKPGNLRFEYRPPSPVLMVAAGGDVYVKNARLNTVDRYSLSDTPLNLLLNQGINLKINHSVMGVEQQDGVIIVHARTATHRNNSNITLEFSASPLELRQWTVRDNQGGDTTVSLSNTQTGMDLPDTLFAVPVKAPPIKQAAP